MSVLQLNEFQVSAPIDAITRKARVMRAPATRAKLGHPLFYTRSMLHHWRVELTYRFVP